MRDMSEMTDNKRSYFINGFRDNIVPLLISSELLNIFYTSKCGM